MRSNKCVLILNRVQNGGNISGAMDVSRGRRLRLGRTIRGFIRQ